VQIEFTYPENFFIHTESLDVVPLRVSCPEYLIKEYELSAQHFLVKVVLGPQSVSEAQLINAEAQTVDLAVPLNSNMVHTRLPEKESRLIFVDSITSGSRSSPNLRVTVSLITKEVPILSNLRGSPAEGYAAGEPQLSLKSILLTGSQEALAKIDKIELQEIDLTGLSKEARTQVEIDAEELKSRYGVHAVRDGDRKIYVTVPIRPVTQARTISDIPVVAKSLPDGSRGTFFPESVEIEIAGPPDLVEKVDPEQLVAEVDLSGRPTGEHFVAFTIRGLPDRVKITRRSSETVDVTLEEYIPEEIFLEEDALR